MNRHILYIVCLCLMLLQLVACKEQEDGPAQKDGTVTLAISAAVATRATDTGDENRIYSELMHTLRIIIFDGDGAVEHNRLYTFSEGLFETEYHYFVVKANDAKTIYLLANCESFTQIQSNEITKETLDAMTLQGQDGLLQPATGTNRRLPATAKYSIVVEDENKDGGTLYLAHAANKIQFQFVNHTGQSIQLHSWTFSSLAPKSYLIPHVNEEKWYQTVMEETDNVVKDYDVPVTPQEHEEYTYEYIAPLPIPQSNEEEGNAVITPDANSPIYLHESKFLVPAEAVEGEEAEWTDEQQYTLTFYFSGVANEEDTEEDTGTETSASKPYTAVLPNLPSLFRGTYIKVKVNINQLEEGEGPDGIYAEIVKWEEEDPVKGTLEPVEDDEEQNNP